VSKTSHLTIGVISDTHGLLRPEAITALQGVHQIIHAGDIGSADILGQLAAIAPVTAVRGNNDKWAKRLPSSELIVLDQQRIFVVHDIAELVGDPLATGYTVVITGHSHKALVSKRQGVLFVNPGSAGPRRFKLPVTLAILKISSADVHASIQVLQIA
jgi:putative phosphoesterase